MGLEAIIEEIKAKGKAEADRISGETYKEVSKIIADAQSQAEKIKTTRQEAVRKEIERLRQQEISSAHLEVKRAVLNARKEILDQVYEASKDSISKFPEERNQKLLKSVIAKNEANNTKIYSREKDRSIVNNLTKLNYAGDINCIGGVIIENKDGTEYLDLRYETILKNASEQSLKQVSDILFR
ncbi:MAG: V-type ATP synthase subunit E [Candidatus Methanoperedens sp.]|nr:V-type ATP synthase subunit E [Candidatus Methanoperedens sp.]MCZ7359425.1 V-type ATP synthase subunit E [Candidatus Methanoperedens sp.]HLB70816.1 V-type ATP synthase subunit E [Candidatus Methanoperedens sp.]